MKGGIKLIKQVFTGENGLELEYTDQEPFLTIDVTFWYNATGTYCAYYKRDGDQKHILCTIPESSPRNTGICWHTATGSPWYEPECPLRKDLLINIWE